MVSGLSLCFVVLQSVLHVLYCVIRQKRRKKRRERERAKTESLACLQVEAYNESIRGVFTILAWRHCVASRSTGTVTRAVTTTIALQRRAHQHTLSPTSI
jgi:hypothetical protein